MAVACGGDSPTRTCSSPVRASLSMRIPPRDLFNPAPASPSCGGGGSLRLTPGSLAAACGPRADGASTPSMGGSTRDSMSSRRRFSDGASTPSMGGGFGPGLGPRDFTPLGRGREVTPSSRGGRAAGGSLSPGRNAVFSEHMHSGAEMQQALGYCPDPLGVRRMSSAPPRRLSVSLGGSDADESRRSPSSRLGSEQISQASSAPSARSPIVTHHVTRMVSSPSQCESWKTFDPVVISSMISNISARLSSATTSELGGESPPVPRLRGPGQAIGQSGRGSPGIPWRQVPTYSPTGSLTKTGDAHIATNIRVRSPKLASSAGMRDILEPVTEPTQSDESASPTRRGSPRLEAWMEVVGQRQELKQNERYHASGMASPTSTADSCVSDETQRTHWSYRPQRKGVSTTFSTKDFCPFFRDDAVPDSRAVQPATPHQRRPQSPQSRLEGTGARASMPCDMSKDPHNFVAEKAADARRDWEFQQNRQALQHGAPRSPQASSRGVASLSGSVSARPQAAPRWR